jgi:hypothetical protein
LEASSRAEAVVTRRQLFPPNPSVRPSVIFFDPHHDGTAVCFADDFGFADEVAAVSRTMPLMSANASSAPLLL